MVHTPVCEVVFWFNQAQLGNVWEKNFVYSKQGFFSLSLFPKKHSIVTVISLELSFGKLC